MNETTMNITDIISNTINNLFGNLFSSLDANIYEVLDDITFINSNIINNSFFSSSLDATSNYSMIIIANSLLLGFTLFYIIRFYYSNFITSQVEQPFQFVFKLLLIAIFINFSYFICAQLLNINSLISLAIREVGENIFNTNISFSSLLLKINSSLTMSELSFNVFSFDGIAKTFISFGLFSLLFAYSLRYIMIQVLVLISPFAVLSLLNNCTAWFFKTWFKSLISLLLLQSLVAIILLIIFSFKTFANDTLTKLIYIGAILALTKSISFIKELVGGLSLDISNNIATIKYLMK